MIILVRVYAHGGLGTLTDSNHNIFDSEKLTLFHCAPDGIRTFILWILRPTLYQLSHPVTPVTEEGLKVLLETKEYVINVTINGEVGDEYNYLFSCPSPPSPPPAQAISFT